MNTLRDADFVNVPSGGIFDPYERIDRYGFFSAHELNAKTFRAVGEYRIRFVYSSEGESIVEWGGDRGAQIANDKSIVAKFSQVPRGKMASNEISITIFDPES